jgi:hypothetical protein
MAVIDIEQIETKDEVISEIRKIKDDLARAFCYDIRKMLDEARIKQKASCRTIVSPPIKKDA